MPVLRRICARRGLDDQGPRIELIARIVGNQGGPAPAPGDGAPGGGQADEAAPNDHQDMDDNAAAAPIGGEAQFGPDLPDGVRYFQSLENWQYWQCVAAERAGMNLPCALR